MPALRPAVFVALPHPPRLLGVWHRASNRWALPGGKLEEGEELEPFFGRAFVAELERRTAG